MFKQILFCFFSCLFLAWLFKYKKTKNQWTASSSPLQLTLIIIWFLCFSVTKILHESSPLYPLNYNTNLIAWKWILWCSWIHSHVYIVRKCLSKGFVNCDNHFFSWLITEFVQQVQFFYWSIFYWNNDTRQRLFYTFVWTLTDR